MLRTRTCRWFELITTRDELAPVMHALASAGTVELQAHAPPVASRAVEGAAGLAERFRGLARTYQRHWPTGKPVGATRIADPAGVFRQRLDQLDAWRVQADPLIAELERLGGERKHLDDLRRLLAGDPAGLPEPGLLGSAGRFVVDARIYALASRSPAVELPADVMQLVIVPGPGGAAAKVGEVDENFVVLVGRLDAVAGVDELMAARKARRVVWPADLHGDVAQATHEVERRRDAAVHRQAALESALQALALRHDLADALADIDLIEWLFLHGSAFPASERLVWITGWTPANDEAGFCAPLERQALRCVVQFSEPPAGAEAPSLLTNPPWVRAFETFARLLGQPGRDEADPSPLVALIAPLLFGFMFGDVGQGAVLCLAGLALRKRIPALVLLIPGGALAMVFGVLFGSVFAREDLIPALWLHPLHEPVALLATAVGLGAVILLGGLALNAAQAVWRGAGLQWWAGDAGLVLAYLGLLAAWAWPTALWAVPGGALWMALGRAWPARGERWTALLRALAQFVEQALQLAVNTVSFARVGALALAHAGLSAAVVSVAEASGAIGSWIVFVLGNLLILLLEGLVVGIQTTRLLLFEFFLRFLKGGGRAFRPLPPPLVQSPTSPGSPP